MTTTVENMLERLKKSNELLELILKVKTHLHTRTLTPAHSVTYSHTHTPTHSVTYSHTHTHTLLMQTTHIHTHSLTHTLKAIHTISLRVSMNILRRSVSTSHGSSSCPMMRCWRYYQRPRTPLECSLISRNALRVSLN